MRHVHKYERRKLGSWKNKGHDIYKCAIPGCTHYMIDMEAVIGRYSLCWGGCSTLVEMTRNLVMHEKRKWPICEICRIKRREERSRFNQLVAVEEDDDSDEDKDAQGEINQCHFQQKILNLPMAFWLYLKETLAWARPLPRLVFLNRI